MSDYVRVVPTSEGIRRTEVPAVFESLHKLKNPNATEFTKRLNPFVDTSPPTFEFIAISEGKDEPVEFYYGINQPAHLETLEKQLNTIYPNTFDVTLSSFDLEQKLIPPTEFTHDEFRGQLEHGNILYQPAEDEIQPLSEEDEMEVTDGGETLLDQDTGKCSSPLADQHVELEDGVFELNGPETLPKDDPLTTIPRPTATEDGTVLARPPVADLEPVGVQWYGTAERKRDWMTTIKSFSSDDPDPTEYETDRSSVAVIIDHLTEAEHPIAFHVVWTRKPDWSDDAALRKEDLMEGRDTFAQRYIGPMFEMEERPDDEKRGHRVGSAAQNRYDRIDAKHPKRTFTVNLRAIAVPSNDETERLERRLDQLAQALDSLDGPFYGLDGTRLRSQGFRKTAKQKRAQKVLRKVLDTDLVTGRGKRKPDLVLNGDELASVAVVPSSEDLSVEGSRGTRSEQRSRNPLPRPHPDLMEQFREGMAIGYAINENGNPEEVPVHIPANLLPTHYGRFGTTGAGKSKALINDLLSLYENTDGPVILIDPKGDGMSENYMRAHARRFGMTDLESNVIHFSMPEILPGFSFFNLKPSLENGLRRADAVQRKADHYEEILKLVMGEDRYERATVAPTLIQTLIKVLFDEEYGRENGLYREDVNYFGHRQLEHIVDQLWQAGPPNPREDEVPRSSDEEVRRTIRRQLQLDPNTFANVMGGVGNRLAYISQDTHLRRIFNNTESRFDFRDALDENTVILFDLGGLRNEAARLMTGVILTNLDDALREQKRAVNQQPDDYVVNLLIDEAASVVVSNIMNDLLEKGRSFRLSVGLSMQFPEQIEAEGGRKVYLNVLNDIGSPIVGKINVDRDLAKAMAHEEMDPTEFANRIRSLPRGEWIAQLPSPTFGETGPYPFSVKPLPIPTGHPESKSPLTDSEEDRFDELLSTIHEQTSDEFGVPETGIASSERSPEAVQEILGTANQDLDQALAKTIRIIQLRDGVRDENGWVAVEDVDAELRACFDGIDSDPPDYDVLADIRERSRLLNVDLDTAADELLVRLTDIGETAAAPDTGDVRASGSEAHDAALLEIEAALTTLEFRVTILTQDGNERPDAKATHPDLDETFAIEAETTTPENPVKVLTNLRKAQDAEHIPLFVVRPGDTETYWAERVEQILSPPVQQLASGETRFYTHDGHITFSGGATEQGGVTAVRPATGETDSSRTVWMREDDEFVLRDGNGIEYTRLPTLADASKGRFPAIYSYDHAADEYVVYEQGEQHVYGSKDAFEADWTRIKKPFIPDDELPVPGYQRSSYGIVILRDDGESVVYEDGATRPLSTLVEGTLQLASTETEQEQLNDKPAAQPSQTEKEEAAEHTDVSFASFVDAFLIEDGETTLPKAEVYTMYTDWAAEHEIDPVNKSWFSRKLGDHIEFETGRERRDGELVRCYTGFRFAPQQETES
ncbi:helicase HerA domain-containing protein [Natrialba sp. SSL1]|uniref:helicase HerA domain-containing protein n=1 Tax=Natrialba sp. SSL1 TaxID=1869245 RepID=UPI0008F80C03|nr:DUF87 domain-containing protein [Natrialba sp. SSL1]OIB57331.1 conjugal transfer protein [Natrialba sp. SSL1]